MENSQTNTYSALGLMSGTSLDGLDIAYVEFQHIQGKWQYRLGPCTTLAYSEKWRNDLGQAIHLSGLELTRLHHRLGAYFGELAQQFIQEHQVSPQWIGSHGHTVFHQPKEGFTLQIGDPYALLVVTRIPVVADFRSLDVALGGQGAPLVPIGDELLFGQYGACINLGGIANISWSKQDTRLAFDIAPANMLLNHIIQPLGLLYDNQGQLAQKGQVNEALFEALNRLAYYQEAYPKSLGVEWFQQMVLPLLAQYPDTVENHLCTACHHIAYQIGQVLDKESIQGEILLTGGGAFHSYLVSLFSQYWPKGCRPVVPEAELINYKEALVFAFLAVLHQTGNINVWKSVTGAQADSRSGILYSL
ncbi:anhydro-N-acetylmuramic acid kinase [Cytophagales bacterium LB-30]|uniref:Anhydro-N-acetylmuramic acid kinase n=1 Tax=Shiella aurantiaca TaxID=3058365 RepID=A0ABT8F6G5_9BACT|nr:anhydro-N-acetylmuramic acid kinase [Shiella aurantiaca]MDN4165821.1 anhydro-N-acetylmuramic acid kinase [Shiella aurantiaca]